MTDETRQTYREFAKEANNLARELGALSTSSVVDAVTVFSRLGLDLEDATFMARQASLLANVGLMSIDEASRALVSSAKGFGLEMSATSNDIIASIDAINEVGNRYAVSQKDLTEALRRSAASLRVAGNDINESIALITAANAVNLYSGLC